MTKSSQLRATNHAVNACGLLISTAIVYVSCAIFVFPMQSHYIAASASIGEEKRLLTQQTEIVASHREARTQLSQSEATFARVISRIPETPHESEFLAQVTELARNCKLRIQRYHPRDPVNEGTHTALEVELDSIADYAGICRFLDGLRTLARLCRVTRLHVRSADIDGSDLVIEMTLRIYFAPMTKTLTPEPHNG